MPYQERDEGVIDGICVQAPDPQQMASAMAAERAKLEEAALPLMLDAMWAANTLDIQQTVKSVCHQVENPSNTSAACN
jgi:hypothetical protein